MEFFALTARQVHAVAQQKEWPVRRLAWLYWLRWLLARRRLTEWPR